MAIKQHAKTVATLFVLTPFAYCSFVVATADQSGQVFGKCFNESAKASFVAALSDSNTDAEKEDLWRTYEVSADFWAARDKALDQFWEYKDKPEEFVPVEGSWDENVAECLSRIEQ